MASPQLQDGYTRIANEIIEALMFAKLNGREFRVLWAVFRLSYGWCKNTEAETSNGQIARITEISRNNVQQIIGGLVKKGILTKRTGKRSIILAFQEDYDKWTVFNGLEFKATLENKSNYVPKNKVHTGLENKAMDRPQTRTTTGSGPPLKKDKERKDSSHSSGKMVMCRKCSQTFDLNDSPKCPKCSVTWERKKR